MPHSGPCVRYTQEEINRRAAELPTCCLVAFNGDVSEFSEDD